MTTEAAHLAEYRGSTMEQLRCADLLKSLPERGGSVLDIGAREGYYSRLLADRFEHVTALDLVQPDFQHPGVTTIAGDVTCLGFADNSFDCVFCTEVLEHVVDLRAACKEIARVSREDIIIGVPYCQDLRQGRTTCHHCGKNNPPWGHVNTFTRETLLDLFRGLEVVSTSYVGKTREVTNLVSMCLMDIAGNPWGTYDQGEPCIYCGREVCRPDRRGLSSRLASATALAITALQQSVIAPRPNWIHMVFRKSRPAVV